MTFDDAMRQAALAADQAVKCAIDAYSADNVQHEPEISAYLAGQLDAKLSGQVGELEWTTTIVPNGSGSSAVEKRVGADILLHVSLNTPLQRYSKGVLIQAKRSEPRELVSPQRLIELQNQCQKMLGHTPAAFVWSYSKQGLRAGSATRFAGTQQRDIHRQCTWTSYRFFLELLRCPIGDPRITTGRVADLPVPLVIHLAAEGTLSED